MKLEEIERGMELSVKELEDAPGWEGPSFPTGSTFAYFTHKATGIRVVISKGRVIGILKPSPLPTLKPVEREVECEPI